MIALLGACRLLYRCNGLKELTLDGYLNRDGRNVGDLVQT